MESIQSRFGIENESRFNLGGRHLAKDSAAVCAEAAKAAGGAVLQFTNNGGRIYPEHGVEFCTPECNSPREAIVYNNVNRRLQIQAIGAVLLAVHREDPTVNKAWLYSRVVDSKGHTWGLHDNYGLTRLQDHLLREADRKLQSSQIQFLQGFTGTRMMYVGAGCADDAGLHLSQKRSKPFIAISKRAIDSTLYTLPPRGMRGTDLRFESRDNDNPWSDWSSEMRLVAMRGALSLMGSRYPLAELHTALPAKMLMPGFENPLNGFDIDSEGLMETDQALALQAADFQLGVLDALLDTKALRYGVRAGVEFADQYKSLYSFLELYKTVVRRQRPVSELSWYVDWAAKAERSRCFHVRHMSGGWSSLMATDLGKRAARVVDIGFDTVIFEVLDGADGSDGAATVQVKPAIGQSLRQRGVLGYRPDEVREMEAMRQPPAGVASRRVGAMRLYGAQIEEINWVSAKVAGRGSRLKF